jgi:hypothetical protein
MISATTTHHGVHITYRLPPQGPLAEPRLEESGIGEVDISTEDVVHALCGLNVEEPSFVWHLDQQVHITCVGLLFAHKAAEDADVQETEALYLAKGESMQGEAQVKLSADGSKAYICWNDEGIPADPLTDDSKVETDTFVRRVMPYGLASHYQAVAPAVAP